MQIPLNQFELYVDETILKRGLSYFKNGYVSEPEEITQGIYEAIVTGSDEYTVELKIKNETVIEHVCSCPYDFGPICKHIVGVLFYLQQDVLELKQKNIPVHKNKEKNTTKKVKKKTIREQVNEVLEKITHDELKSFILEKSEHNPPFRNIFLSTFSHKNASESKELYAKQVRTILRTAAGREGFIHWNQIRSVGKTVHEFLTSAQQQFANKNFRSSIFICTAVMEEMTEALQFADDSNADIGGNITISFEMLLNIAKEKLPEEIRTQLFEYCLSSFEKQIYSGWDWHIGVMQIASEIFIGEEEAQQIITCINKLKNSEYENEEAQIIQYSIIKKTKGEKEADKFILKNISNPSLRREAIEKELKNKKYKKAISLAKDGIKSDQENKPGLALEWYDWLLQIAQAEKDKEKIIEYARLLFINNFRQEQDYYHLLKNTVKANLWNSFVENIIKDISATNNWFNFDSVAKIFITEEWWGRLLELIKQNPLLNYIENYEKFLSKDYSDELIQLYSDAIIIQMKNSTGRIHYRTACKYLRRMIKLGGRKYVEKIIADFRIQYPHRKALMQELDQV